MPKIVEKDTLSRDTGTRIRRHCFNNLKEFHSRYLSNELSYYYFMMVVSYKECNKDYVDIVEVMARDLMIVAGGEFRTDNAELLRLNVLSLVNHIDKTLAIALSFENLLKLKAFAEDIRPMVS